jgi:hypothetical protein
LAFIGAATSKNNKDKNSVPFSLCNYWTSPLVIPRGHLGILSNLAARESFNFKKVQWHFRPETNAVILLDMGHMLRGGHIQEE